MSNHCKLGQDVMRVACVQTAACDCQESRKCSRALVSRIMARLLSDSLQAFPVCPLLPVP